MKLKASIALSAALGVLWFNTAHSATLLAPGAYTTPPNSVTSVDTLGNISIKAGFTATYAGIVNGPAQAACSTATSPLASDYQFNLSGMLETNPVSIQITGVGGSAGNWTSACTVGSNWSAVLQGTSLFAGVYGNNQTSFTITLTYADGQIDTTTAVKTF